MSLGTLGPMRRVCLTGFLALACLYTSFARGTSPVYWSVTPGSTISDKKILLIPVDDRPATTQFTQMIGAIAGYEVLTPPSRFLGRFNKPGDPDAILEWAKSRDLRKYSAVVVSAEMVTCGGLISSRSARTPVYVAKRRLAAIDALKRSAPNVPFYAFSAIQRIAPTAFAYNANWQQALAKYAVIKSTVVGRGNRQQRTDLERLKRIIPDAEITRYYAARERNHQVQLRLLDMVDRGTFDYLILGQDDAQPVGPHVAETRSLSRATTEDHLQDKVYFSEGIDQLSSVIVSRAILKSSGWSPRVRINYADEIGKGKIAPYESAHVEDNLKDQLIASGAVPVNTTFEADYTLYVNTPDPRQAPFDNFLQELTSDIDQGFPVAVADINLGKTGTGDARLFDALCASGRAMKLLSYAGWNTAGNTMGTAIPAANLYLFARRDSTDPIACELNQRAFLLHRMVNDFEYHRYTRPKVYELQRELGLPKEEVYGQPFATLNEFVQKDLSERLTTLFKSQFEGRTFFAGPRQYRMDALRNINIQLPWPRAYEVKLGFTMEATAVN